MREPYGSPAAGRGAAAERPGETPAGPEEA